MPTIASRGQVHIAQSQRHILFNNHALQLDRLIAVVLLVGIITLLALVFWLSGFQRITPIDDYRETPGFHATRVLP